MQGFPRVTHAGGGFHDNLPSSSLVGYDCYVCFRGCSDVHETAGGHSCSGHEYGHCYQSRSRCLSRVRPVSRLGPASTSVRERVPAVVLSFTPRSVPTIPVPMGDGVPAVPSSVPQDCPTPSSSLTSGQSATPSQTLAWGDAGDSSPNRIQAGCYQDVPEEGSLFHVSPVSPGFLTRPSRDAPAVSSGGGVIAVDDGRF